MADNYLENKMDELRRGQVVSSIRRSSGARKGVVSFPFPPRKIIIAGIEEETAFPIIRKYMKLDCKVAYLGEEAEIGSRLAHDEGVRFCKISVGREDLTEAFDNVIKAWRDIDIIISTEALAPALAEKWRAHLQSFRIPRSYKGRLIIISSETPESLQTLASLMHPAVCVNALTDSMLGAHQLRTPTPEDMARALLFLTLPGNDYFTGLLL